ncbi:MAG: selenide, water dikinase SelD [Chitinophagaceae bacterium]|nr:selenide, water dikinase SelD [Chitinophagaceae bacterium]
MQTETNVKLTQYSHGAGCGCKISPKILEQILSGSLAMPDNKNLLVGNHSKDDAAVYDLGNGTALISTTDFFMPVVDDPYEFGRIAAANAISDVYAMGGKPLLAIAILGWPVNKLDPSVAQRVIEGGKSICVEAGIPLAGGHSIDSPEPIFGLAVNGLVFVGNVKQNNTAKAGDLLYLTKPLGVGILTTAEKKGILKAAHQGIAAKQMMQLNKIGTELGELPFVNAMTDVTGFGLLGHLAEIADGSNLTAVLPNMSSIPLITDDLQYYIEQKSIPGGTLRNWDSYGHSIAIASNLTATEESIKAILADPQTSGGLLISVDPAEKSEVELLFGEYGIHSNGLIGYMKPRDQYSVVVGE